MNHYQKYKDSVLTYFKTEEGRKHMKEAQRRYQLSEGGQKKNREGRMKSYYKTKAFNDEFKRLNAIELF
jgi:hypothetical protein